jgi:hypothetical protein
MVMRLTEAQLKKWLEYIRQEVRSLEGLAESIERTEKQGRRVSNIPDMIRKRASAIDYQLKGLEKNI